MQISLQVTVVIKEDWQKYEKEIAAYNERCNQMLDVGETPTEDRPRPVEALFVNINIVAVRGTEIQLYGGVPNYCLAIYQADNIAQFTVTPIVVAG